MIGGYNPMDLLINNFFKGTIIGNLKDMNRAIGSDSILYASNEFTAYTAPRVQSKDRHLQR